MKFIELKKNLKEKVGSAYLLYGNDVFLLNYSLNLIKENIDLQPLEMNYIEFKNDNIDFGKVVDALNTMPIFSEYKLIYVNIDDSVKFNGYEQLIEYLSNTNKSSVLVLNVNNRIKEFEKIRKLVLDVDCSHVDKKIIIQFVAKELKNYNKTISDDAVLMLMDLCLNDLGFIVNEIQKLVSYIGERSEIKIEDVQYIVNKTIEYQIFDFTESLARKNSKRVFEIFTDMKTKKDNDKVLLSLISNHFRRLLHISLSKIDDSQLSVLLSVKPYAVVKMREQVKYFGQKMLKDISDICFQQEFLFKSGEVSFDNAVNIIIFSILNTK